MAQRTEQCLSGAGGGVGVCLPTGKGCKGTLCDNAYVLWLILETW